MVTYLITKKFLIPRVIEPFGNAVIAVLLKRHAEPCKTEDVIQDETYVRNTVHQFNNTFYSIAAVTPSSNISPFTSSPNLLNVYLDNCETLRQRTIDSSIATPVSSVIRVRKVRESSSIKLHHIDAMTSMHSPRSTVNSPTPESVPSSSRFIALSQFSTGSDPSSLAVNSSTDDMYNYLNDSEEEQLGIDRDGLQFLTTSNRASIDKNEVGHPVCHRHLNIISNRMLLVLSHYDFSFISSPCSINKYLDENEEDRLDNEDIAQILDDIDEGPLGHRGMKRNITSYIKRPPSHILTHRFK